MQSNNTNWHVIPRISFTKTKSSLSQSLSWTTTYTKSSQLLLCSFVEIHGSSIYTAMVEKTPGIFGSPFPISCYLSLFLVSKVWKLLVSKNMFHCMLFMLNKTKKKKSILRDGNKVRINNFIYIYIYIIF